jgi:hypothetical protein
MILNLNELSPRMADLTDCVVPIDNMPMSEEGKKLIHDYERANPITLKIRHIPHLRLNLPVFDLETALREVQQYYEKDDFVPLDLKGIPVSEGGNYFRYDGAHGSWGSRALVNYTTASSGTWGKDDKELAIRDFPHLQERAAAVQGRRLYLHDMNFYKTTAWDELPYLTNYIMENICGDFSNLRRVFLFRLKSGGCINFHNHRFLPWDEDAALHDEGIIHIPLITHPSSLMCQQIGDSDLVDVQHYGAGEAWLFNSYTNHAVDGINCPIDRLHFTVVVDFSDKKFTDIIESSLGE